MNRSPRAPEQVRMSRQKNKEATVTIHAISFLGIAAGHSGLVATFERVTTESSGSTTCVGVVSS
jgi:hypothetical protein